MTTEVSFLYRVGVDPPLKRPGVLLHTDSGSAEMVELHCAEGLFGGRRRLRVQLLKPLDQRRRFGSAGPGRVAGRMVPRQNRYTCLRKHLANRHHHGIQGQLGTESQIKHALARIGGRSVLTKAQQLSNTFRRRSSGTLISVSPDVQSAVTISTNWRSGIPGRWRSRVCIRTLSGEAGRGVNHHPPPRPADHKATY